MWSSLDRIYFLYFYMGFVMEYTTIPERYYFLNYYSVSTLTILNTILNISWGIRPLVATQIDANNRNLHIAGVTACCLWFLLVWSIMLKIDTGFIILTLCLVEFTTTIIYYTLDTYTSNIGSEVNIYKCYRYRLIGSFIGSLIGSKIYVEFGLIYVFASQACLIITITFIISQIKDNRLFLCLQPQQDEEADKKELLTRRQIIYIVVSSIIPTSYVMLDYYTISVLHVNPVKQSYIDLIGGLFGLLGTYPVISNVFLYHSMFSYTSSLIICLLVDRVLISYYNIYFLVAKSSLLMFSQTMLETYIMKTTFDNYQGDTVNIALYTTLPYISTGLGTFISSFLTYIYEIDHGDFKNALQVSLICLGFVILPVFFIPRRNAVDN